MPSDQLFLFESLSEAIATVDYDARVTSWNQAAEVFYGVPAANAVGQPIEAVTGLSEHARQWETLCRHVDRVGMWRGDVTCGTDGDQGVVMDWEVLPLRLHPKEDPRGLVVIARKKEVGEHTDVATEPKEALFRAILDSIKEVVVVRDANHRLDYCNPAFSRVTGYDPEEMLVTGDLTSIIHPDDQPSFFSAIREFVETGADFDAEGRYHHKDGSLRWFRNRAVLTEVQGDRKMIITLDDLTAQKEAEIALQQARDELEARVQERTASLERAREELEEDIAAREEAERDRDRLENELRRSQTLEAVGRLAGGVAHDFNNLLGSVLGCLYSARMNAGGNAGVLEELDRAQELCKRGGEVTRQLLTVARRRAGRTESIPTAALLEEAKAFLERTLPKHIHLEFQLGQALPHIRGDRSLLTTALLNLGLNANDAMPQGGTLTLSARKTRGNGDRSGVLVEVTDTGSGIPQHIQSKIFEPFFTTKSPDEGTGMGLAMVYATVKECGGKISVRSGMGEGTTFRLTLPGVEPPLRVAHGLNEVHSGGHPLLDGPILVVEDEPEVARMMTDVLERHGYDTLHATTGIEALEIVRDNRETIDLVALDLMLPELGGAEVYRFLKSLVPDLPVVFTTGREDLAQQIDADIAVLPKPFRDQDLLAKLREMFTAPAGADSAAAGVTPAKR